MKPEFSNLEIDFWVHPRKLGFSQPTLCLFHDSLEIGSPILDALQELKNETPPAQRKLTFAACSRERSLLSLRLLVAPKSEDLQVMSIRCDSDNAKIEMTETGLELVINAFNSWLQGAEDFGVFPDQTRRKSQSPGKRDRQSGELWFWGPSYTGP